MRLLITGSSGFIGRGIIPPAHAEVFHCSRNKYNLLNESDISALLADFRPTHLLHLAWFTGSDYVQSSQNWLWLEAGKYLVAKFYEKFGQRFVGCGTCYEYDIGYARAMENDKCHPSTTYGRAKFELGRFVQVRAAARGLSWAWGRPFFIMGPNDRMTRFIPSLVSALVQKQRFVVASPERTVDYLDRRDVAAAFSALIAMPVNGIFNICSGKGLKLGDIARCVADFFIDSDTLDFGSATVEPMYCVGDNARLKTAIGFAPSYSLAETLSDCVADLRRRLDGNA